MIRLGPFSLTKMIGEGGMGQIWHGRHAKQDVDVAIKIIRPERITGSRQNQLFHREALAMATLNHRAIIGVYDFGLLSPHAAAASGGVLVEDSPYLVMDYAPSGSLWDVPPPKNWRELKATLMQVLDGLAHAHAHELIHRDLKPGNVLVTSREGDRQLKLTDFGLAYIGAPESFSAEMEMSVGCAGTPAYMAPEQIRGLWREIGPWTDLYALGCMAFELATGAPPFVRPAATGILLAQLSEDPPPLDAALSLPPRFSPWVGRLMEKSPKRRFRSAADAAWALANLDLNWEAPDEDVGAHGVCPLSETSYPEGSLTHLFGDPTLFLTDLDAPKKSYPRPGPDIDEDLVPVELPPMPKDWKVDDSPRLIPLAGVGLGLFGMRRIGLVGRHRQRDAIWQALARTRADSKPRALVLRGPAGCGKSALADWISRRAVEVGAATLVHVRAGMDDTPGQVLAAPLNRFFRADGLTGHELESHLAARINDLDPDGRYGIDGEALARGICAEAHTKQISRGRAIWPVLQCLAARRPVILWLDDVQWSSDAIELTRNLIGQSGLSVLCILTVRDEALVERPVERGQLRELLDHDHIESFTLEPMSESEQRRLIRQLLPVDGALVEQLVDRSGGNPLFVVELLGDWIQHGLLVGDQDGFRAPAGTQTNLPDSVHQVWSERLERILSGFSSKREDFRQAIELAACLGRVIDKSQWFQACKLAGLDVGPELIALFADEYLIRGDGQRGTFAHEMLRESILRLAEEGGRLNDHHRICLEVVEKFYDDDQALERRYVHMLGAGLAKEAILPLIELARRRAESYDHHGAIRCCMVAEEALDQLDEPDDALLIRVWSLLAVSHYYSTPDVAEEYISRILKRGRFPRDAQSLARTARVQAWLAQTRGDLALAEEHHEGVLRFFTHLGDEMGAAGARMGLADVARLAGKYEVADSHLRIALKTFRSHDNHGRISDALRGLGHIAVATGHFDEARNWLREALRYAGSDLARQVRVRGALAECSRFLGDVVEAEVLYRKNYDYFVEQDTPNAHVCAINLATTLVQQERFDEAIPICELAMAGMKRQKHLLHLAMGHLILAICAAALEKLAAWEENFPQAQKLIEAAPVIDRDYAWAAEEAGRLASKAGWHDEAEAATILAMPIWQALGGD